MAESGDTPSMSEMVETVLENHPETRNLDLALWAQIIKDYYAWELETPAENVFDIANLLLNWPSLEAVTKARQRAITKTGNMRWLPTLWSVAKKRHIHRLNWNHYIEDLANTDAYLYLDEQVSSTPKEYQLLDDKDEL